MKNPYPVLRAFLVLLSVITFIFSCEQPGNPPAPTAPAAPTGVTAEAASFCRIIVRWTDNSNNETGFVIERSTSADFITVTSIPVPADTEAWSDRDGLSETTTYYYRVLATNNGLNSDSAEALGGTATRAQPTAITGSRRADHNVINHVRSGTLPIAMINAAKTGPAALHIGYGHTSHGSQLTDGMNGLVGFANGAGCNGLYSGETDLFAWNRGGTGGALDLREGSGYGGAALDLDCGYYPNWVESTRAYLDDPANYEVNVIIWSWCGQAAGYSEAYMEEAYLDPMAQLEADYPDITFIYMTCHLNGTGTTGPDANLHFRNEQIRDFCGSTRWLFDFADIESYDPDGLVDYCALYANDNCDYDSDNNGVCDANEQGFPGSNSTNNWAIAWQEANIENTDWYDCGAAHSQSLNANMKAYAAWWLWCRLSGWDGN